MVLPTSTCVVLRPVAVLTVRFGPVRELPLMSDLHPFVYAFCIASPTMASWSAEQAVGAENRSVDMDRAGRHHRGSRCITLWR